MASLSDLQKGDTSAVVSVLIVGGLGFYLAIALSDAVKATTDKFLPEQEDQVARSWISFVISLIIVVIIVYIMITYFKSQLQN